MLWATCSSASQLQWRNLPSYQSKPLLAQHEAISSCPVPCHLRAQAPHGYTLHSGSCRNPKSHCRVSFSPGWIPPAPLAAPYHTHAPVPSPAPFSLETLQALNVPVIVRDPEPTPGLEVQPHQCQVQRDNHCSCPAGPTAAGTSQDAVSLFGHLGTMPAHIQLQSRRLNPG